MITTPFIDTLCSMWRIASTAAPSAPFLSPRPIQRAAASDAASVTRTISMARLRSGACVELIHRRYRPPVGRSESCQHLDVNDDATDDVTEIDEQDLEAGEELIVEDDDHITYDVSEWAG